MIAHSAPDFTWPVTFFDIPLVKSPPLPPPEQGTTKKARRKQAALIIWLLLNAIVSSTLEEYGRPSYFPALKTPLSCSLHTNESHAGRTFPLFRGNNQTGQQ
ncbi:hypothetical protein Dda3937_04489 [Dickeya dadantii 3937]|uniref:Uncharacterized protein n=1 Tax=Dickeya dadantii (strain 3937) TaxID=198628 RepID=E0SCF3_DICD3|nr:hypothetical protein Dda3937_04489 [Dickeya dadantii 3937]